MNRLRKSALPNKKIKDGIIGMFVTLAAAVPVHSLCNNNTNNHYKHFSLSGKRHPADNEIIELTGNQYHKRLTTPVAEEDSVRIFNHRSHHMNHKHNNLDRKNFILYNNKNILPIQLAHLRILFKNSPINIFIHDKIKFDLKHSIAKSIYNPIGGMWYKLRMCESGNNYSLNTGNGYYGAYQFALSTWWAIGFTGLPNQASPAIQDKAAITLQKISGWIAWPQCAGNLGLLN